MFNLNNNQNKPYYLNLLHLYAIKAYNSYFYVYCFYMFRLNILIWENSLIISYWHDLSSVNILIMEGYHVSEHGKITHKINILLCMNSVKCRSRLFLYIIKWSANFCAIYFRFKLYKGKLHSAHKWIWRRKKNLLRSFLSLITSVWEI